ELRALRCAEQRDACSIDFGTPLQPLACSVESLDWNICERRRQLGNLALGATRRIVRKAEHREASRCEARSAIAREEAAAFGSAEHNNRGPSRSSRQRGKHSAGEFFHLLAINSGHTLS